MRRRYRGPTLVLETEFEAPRGTGRLVDCMRLWGSHPRVERVVEGVRGEVPMLMRFVPRFDSGRVIPEERRAPDNPCARPAVGPGHTDLIQGLYDAHRTGPQRSRGEVPELAIASPIATEQLGTFQLPAANRSASA